VTSQTKPHILIVDDDEAICMTLSAILQAEGYQTTQATTAKEALAKAKGQFFNVALLDIKLPDMEGTQLLARLQEIAPETKKIMVTGYPSLKNAVEALNLGADSYTMKPINPAELLKTIRNKLEVQQQAQEMTREKLVWWIESEARSAQASNFQEFLEKAATLLTDFGVTKNQAKTYIALLSLGIASPSEVASLSKIRREEVYRIMQQLEKQGMITRRPGTPSRFTVIQPEIVLQHLTKTKLTAMREEIERLEPKQADLLSRLKTITLPVKQPERSVELISQSDEEFRRLTEMAGNAEHHIDLMDSLLNLKLAYVNHPRKLAQRILKSVKLRVITEEGEIDALLSEILQFAKTNNNPPELRFVEKLPFNLLIVDDKEAMWGENNANNEDTRSFWTNDPTQITILKTSFESLWQKSSPAEFQR